MFTITIQTVCSGYSQEPQQDLETRSFETKELAKKEIRKMVKNEGFVKIYNNYLNKQNQTELHFNF